MGGSIKKNENGALCITLHNNQPQTKQGLQDKPRGHVSDSRERERKLGLTSVRLVIGLFIEIVFLIDRYVYGIRYMYSGKGWQLRFGKSLKCSLRGYCC